MRGLCSQNIPLSFLVTIQHFSSEERCFCYKYYPEGKSVHKEECHKTKKRFRRRHSDSNQRSRVVTAAPTSLYAGAIASRVPG